MNKWLNWTPPIKEKDSLIIKEDRSEESPHYFGMSLSPCTEPHRLELFWSILGECIDERKEFKPYKWSETDALGVTHFDRITHYKERMFLECPTWNIIDKANANKELLQILIDATA